MKYLYKQNNVIACLTGFLFCWAACLWAQPGLIDSTYGTNGVVLADIDTGSSDYAKSVLVQSDGKVVVAGYSEKSGNKNLALIRLLVNGSLDPDFGTAGIVLSDLGSDDRFYAAALDEHQNIIVGGYSNGGDFATVRYLPDGSPDESFGSNGIVFTDFQNDFDYAKALVLQPDGKIVVAGSSADPDHPGGADFALIRYNSNGSPDTTFGDQGKVLTAIGPGWDEVWGIVIQADGKLLVGGETEGDPYLQPCMARYNPDGTLDTSFGSGGFVVESFNSGHSNARWIGLAPDGKIITVGRADPSYRIARYHRDGSPDPSFNGTGELILDQSVMSTGLVSGVVTADGRIAVGGSGRLPSNSSNFLVGRINPDGTVDTTFGENGFLTRGVTFGGSDVTAMASTPDGNLIAVGSGSDGGSPDFTIVKYLNDLQVGTLNFESPAKEVLVYPNPIVDMAMLRYDLEAEQRITIRLLDLAGKPIDVFVQDQWQAPGSYQQPITLPDALPSGLYLLQISSPNGQMTIKVLK
ncbi:MAG: T9SS type A sorting domain-containing protein [Bacteroidetes bacterium]|nr:MAG: T9SS type A sorting domain-containing protein [Bacteroidota bacterium]